MKKFTNSLTGIILVLFLGGLFGCSGSDSPALPSPGGESFSASRTGLSAGPSGVSMSMTLSDGSILSDLTAMTKSEGHGIMGIWRVRLYDDGTYEVIQKRTEQMHVGITGMVLNSPGALQISLGPPPGPNLFDFNITLSNPTNITGYDVTGIIRASGDIKFLNPDSYTMLFSTPGDTKPNPYAAWDTGVGNREFHGLASHAEMLRFEKGGLTKFAEMDYIFQASWPSNQEEPYAIWGLLADGQLLSNGSNAVALRCRVGDWQGNIDSVLIDLTPIGGVPGTPMSFVSDNIWEVAGVGYSPTGQGVGEHLLEVTAFSDGGATYNYIPVTVQSAGPIIQGPFEVVLQNIPLNAPNGPTDGMDIAVMGAADGSSVSMVFGGDDTWHFWNSDYSDGSFGLYYADSGDPISPFDLPNWRFDFSDTDIPDSSGDSIFNLSWGEANQSTEILDASSIPQILARERIGLWYLNGSNLKLTSNVLVIGADPGPPVTYTVVVRPIEFASGFNQDGFLYTVLAYDAGDESEFPIVDIMALTAPLDWQGNPELVTGGYEVALNQGSGTNFVNRGAIVGVDVDDSLVLPVSGGYAGHAWVAVAESSPENVLEIIDAEVNPPSATYITVPLPSEPLDVEILPVKTAGGGASNIICVLCKDNVLRLYDYAGTNIGNAGGNPYMIGNGLRLDIDDRNLKVHVLHEVGGTVMVTVYEWVG